MKRLLFLIITSTLLLSSSSAKVIRLLAIGNSFSEDAVEQNLYELCLEDGDTLLIGDAYQSGYSLKMHWEDVESHKRNIEYCKVIKGKRYIYKNYSLDSILTDEPWDIVTFQQASQDAGDISTYEPYLTSLLKHCQAKVLNPNVRFGFQQTWAYAKSSTHPGFARYGKDQLYMYKSIVSAVNKAVRQHPHISFIVPSGTAVQNARTSSIGDNMNRDGFHLNYTIGRYTVACAWSEIITGKSSIGKYYCPKGVSAELRLIGQRAAHAAVLNPNGITEISSLEVPLLQNVYGRETQSLNGDWNYIEDPMQVGYLDYWNKEVPHSYGENRKPSSPIDLVEYDFDKSPKMRIPCDWNTANDRLFFYEGSIWFKKDFTYSKDSNKRCILYFGAVNYQADVYLNGSKIGKHIGGFTPFNYDVTDIINDGKNFVVLKVDNSRKIDNVPTWFFDWWNYGGITRDVMLVTVDNTYLADYNLSLDKKGKGIISFYAKLNKPSKGIKVTLSIPELKIKKTLPTDLQGQVSCKFNANPILWSPDNPKLYTVNLTLAKQIGVISDKIGFRTIETRGKQLLLNGKPIFLRGISIHEERAYKTGRANCAADADTLLNWAKDLGCNYVRFAHYPHNEYAVREAERLGILVWSEIPVYWTISWNNKDTYANAQRQLHDMIYRDKNRANVIIWSMANETPRSQARDNFLSKLAQYARTQDSTRLISMAMEVTEASSKYENKLNDNMNKFVDILSFNEYIGWYRDINDIDKMSWIIPYDKPVIISEMGGGAVAGRHGSADAIWNEEYQEQLYRKSINMFDKIDGLVGTTPWILKDFLSPRRTLYGTQDWYNRKGLISNQGVKKKAFYVLKDWYSKKAKQYNN